MSPAPPRTRSFAVEEPRLQISLYDRVSSLLLALLISIGVLVLLLFVIWVTNRIFVSQTAVPVDMVEVSEDGEGGGDGRAAGGTQLDTPSEAPVMDKKNQDAPDAQEEMNVASAEVVASADQLDDPQLEPAPRGSYGSGGGMYGGFGPGRGLGHGPGKPGLPRHWEITFSKATLEAYARELDFFKIELGVLMPDNKIVYAYNLSKPRPDSRSITDPFKNEKRYYLTWRNGRMQQADRDLLARAGVDVGDRPIFKFLPRETEIQLVTLERSYRSADPKNIGKTRFGVQAAGNKFAFYVIEQTLKR